MKAMALAGGVRIMALQDHFRPPLSVRHHWHAFHNAWATYISSALNQRLPEGYFAEANVQFGIEIAVPTFEETDATLTYSASPGDDIDYPSTEISVGWTGPRWLPVDLDATYHRTCHEQRIMANGV